MNVFDINWFNNHPNLVLNKGQKVYLDDRVHYKIGDGVTPLSQLNWRKDIKLFNEGLDDVSFKYGYDTASGRILRIPMNATRKSNIDFANIDYPFFIPVTIQRRINIRNIAIRIQSINTNASKPFHSVEMAFYKIDASISNSRYLNLNKLGNSEIINISAAGIYSFGSLTFNNLDTGNYAVGILFGKQGKAISINPLVVSISYDFSLFGNNGEFIVIMDNTLTTFNNLPDSYSYDMSIVNNSINANVPFVLIRYDLVT
ncbi:MAG: hypothetical protein KatS3mg096_610 [Candidatus Parcubacteria bacterium]|nr:MAG: hypothetical protein KatS3mg096_610 [Candidatus Parcubacteria bacterium]